MNTIIKMIWIVFLCLVSANLSAQAQLTIENKSQRQMTVRSEQRFITSNGSNTPL